MISLNEEKAKRYPPLVGYTVRDFSVSDLELICIHKDNLEIVSTKLNIPYIKLRDDLEKGIATYKNQEISYGSYFIIKDEDCIYVPDENLPMIKNLFGLDYIERIDKNVQSYITNI